jgi:hypothetical protein
MQNPKVVRDIMDSSVLQKQLKSVDLDISFATALIGMNEGLKLKNLLLSWDKIEEAVLVPSNEIVKAGGKSVCGKRHRFMPLNVKKDAVGFPLACALFYVKRTGLCGVCVGGFEERGWV